MERINVRVEGSLKQKLEIEAARRGVSPSSVVRRALEEHLGRQAPPENCLQLAERLGILGSIKGLPADLTTNPEYMEGFGRD
jgi:hypothetical protein